MLKAMLNKFLYGGSPSSSRSCSSSNEELTGDGCCGDYLKSFKSKDGHKFSSQEIYEGYWMTQAHPSKDNYGIPIYSAADYRIRKRMGRVGLSSEERKLLYLAELRTNDDDDEDLPTFDSPPLDLRAPALNLLLEGLPKFMHRALSEDYKKDCRMWLWKGPKGKLARDHMKYHIRRKECRFGESICCRYVVCL